MTDTFTKQQQLDYLENLVKIAVESGKHTEAQCDYYNKHLKRVDTLYDNWMDIKPSFLGEQTWTGIYIMFKQKFKDELNGTALAIKEVKKIQDLFETDTGGSYPLMSNHLRGVLRRLESNES